MPGPRNAPKKKRKSQAKSQKKKETITTLVIGQNLSPNSPSSTVNSALSETHSFEYSSPSPPTPLTPSPVHFQAIPVGISPKKEAQDLAYSAQYRNYIEQVVLQEPFIHDPGNGPRVRDMYAFLDSQFFSQPPTIDDPLCAEFAQEAVLQMLQTVLPEETALILWYNKSRATSRICPACRRLYHLGDILQEHLNSDEDGHSSQKYRSPHLQREQEMSGICSPVCFILASFNYPGAIKSAWGRTAEEIDEYSWQLLNGPGGNSTHGDVSKVLGMVVKMTRLHDLGLGQLCLGQDYNDDDNNDEIWNDTLKPTR